MVKIDKEILQSLKQSKNSKYKSFKGFFPNGIKIYKKDTLVIQKCLSYMVSTSEVFETFYAELLRRKVISYKEHGRYRIVPTDQQKIKQLTDSIWRKDRQTYLTLVEVIKEWGSNSNPELKALIEQFEKRCLTRDENQSQKTKRQDLFVVSKIPDDDSDDSDNEGNDYETEVFDPELYKVTTVYTASTKIPDVEYMAKYLLYLDKIMDCLYYVTAHEYSVKRIIIDNNLEPDGIDGARIAHRRGIKAWVNNNIRLNWEQWKWKTQCCNTQRFRVNRSIFLTKVGFFGPKYRSSSFEIHVTITPEYDKNTIIARKKQVIDGGVGNILYISFAYPIAIKPHLWHDIRFSIRSKDEMAVNKDYRRLHMNSVDYNENETNTTEDNNITHNLVHFDFATSFCKSSSQLPELKFYRGKDKIPCEIFHIGETKIKPECCLGFWKRMKKLFCNRWFLLLFGVLLIVWIISIISHNSHKNEPTRRPAYH